MKTFKLRLLGLHAFPGPVRLRYRPLLRARGTEPRRRAARLTIHLSGNLQPSPIPARE